MFKISVEKERIYIWYRDLYLMLWSNGFFKYKPNNLAASCLIGTTHAI